MPNTTTENITQHRQAIRELDWQIRSNRSLISICSYEEKRVVEAIKIISRREKDTGEDGAIKQWAVFQWDIASGLLTPPNLEKYLPKQKIINHFQVFEWFSALKMDDKDGYAILVLKDFMKLVEKECTIDDFRAIRMLRNMANDFPSQHKTIILLNTKLTLPDELSKICAIIDWPLPEYEHIEEKVNKVLQHARSSKDLVARGFVTTYSNVEMEEIVRAFQGLTIQEIEQLCTYMMINESRKLDPAKIAEEKRSIIRKSGLLDWIEVKDNMDAVGGLKGIKHWLTTRNTAFTKEARAYGLPSNPNGLLFVGVQGAGKSLIARSISSIWRLPLLRLDMGKVFSGIVGSSEENMRAVIKVAESVSPSLLWIDELDKGMSGSASSNQTDGGTASRVLGSFLTWMQEKTAPVFVIATANDVSQLPPELLRKGRFDEIFFVDLPNDEERLEIFRIHITKRNRKYEDYNVNRLVEVSASYTGAEIEAAITSAMYEAYADNARQFTTQDIINAIEETVPLAVTMKENIDELRAWASKRARNASHINVKKKQDIETQETKKSLMASVNIGEDEEL